MNIPMLLRVSVSLLIAMTVAQVGQAESITLSPAVVPLGGAGGQSVTQSLTLHNNSEVALDFVLEARDVIVRDGARVVVEAGDLPDSIAASAVFSRPQVTVAAGASEVVSVTMTLPATMRHRAVVAYFRGTQSVGLPNRRALLSLGTLFTFTVSDAISIDAGELAVTPPSATTDLRLRSHVRNDGQEPVVPSGVAAILDVGGRLVGKTTLESHRLLPGEAADFGTDYVGDVPPGTYLVVMTLDVDGRAYSKSAALTVQ
jgi:hypothetical protein